MLSEKLRWEVYRTIETGDVSYWYKQSKEDIPKEFLENNEIISGIFENKTWLESRAYKYHFEPALFDYMGVFEIAYKMIKKHELPWSNFKMSYLYRIESLLKNPIVKKELFGNEEAYWKCFFSLIKKLKQKKLYKECYKLIAKLVSKKSRVVRSSCQNTRTLCNNYFTLRIINNFNKK